MTPKSCIFIQSSYSSFQVAFVISHSPGPHKPVAIGVFISFLSHLGYFSTALPNLCYLVGFIYGHSVFFGRKLSTTLIDVFATLPFPNCLKFSCCSYCSFWATLEITSAFLIAFAMFVILDYRFWHPTSLALSSIVLTGLFLFLWWMFLNLLSFFFLTHVIL